MPFDPSRAIYAHSCGQLPCTCIHKHKQLKVITIICEKCSHTGENGKVYHTVNELAEHHLQHHATMEKPYARDS
jgi:hypothetical protein